ncbi:MAG: PKD domain-containing protein, partial [Solirubrobacterales bacterium]
SHTYTDSGTFTASLLVTDGRGGEDTATVEIQAGNDPPAPSISSPVMGQRFSVGEAITLSGSATDPQEGDLPPGALTWEVIRHHDTHTHPFLPPTTGAQVEIEGPQPEDIHATATSHLAVILTATDSGGLSTTVRRDLLPRTVDLTFESVPSGLRVEVAGSPVTAPQTVTSWEGWRIPVDAPEQADAAGSGVTFVSWSDGGAPAHEVTTPPSAATYTARFTHAYARPKAASPARLPLVIAHSPCVAPDMVHGPPLEHPSCAQPDQASGRLTTGTPDTNGEAANMVGHVRLAVRPGDPATTADEADVNLEVALSDVREVLTLADYPGELELTVPLRITDRLNGGSVAETGTISDQTIRATVPCAITVDLLEGSACALGTTLDALVPGLAAERSRAIWALGQATLNDGGADGDAETPDNTPYAVPGIFIP